MENKFLFSMLYIYFTDNLKKACKHFFTGINSTNVIPRLQQPCHHSVATVFLCWFVTWKTKLVFRIMCFSDEMKFQYLYIIYKLHIIYVLPILSTSLLTLELNSINIDTCTPPPPCHNRWITIRRAEGFPGVPTHFESVDGETSNLKTIYIYMRKKTAF